MIQYKCHDNDDDDDDDDDVHGDKVRGPYNLEVKMMFDEDDDDDDDDVDDDGHHDEVDREHDHLGHYPDK